MKSGSRTLNEKYILLEAFLVNIYETTSSLEMGLVAAKESLKDYRKLINRYFRTLDKRSITITSLLQGSIA